MSDHSTKSAEETLTGEPRPTEGCGCTSYPMEPLCKVEGCGHKNASHHHGFAAMGCWCGECRINSKNGFNVPIYHEFEPRLLAGGALTPDAERAAYERALRGE